MFEEGSVLYFNPFYFEDGTSKPKYFIVLRRVGERVVLASLPTSKDHVPSSVARVHGCIEAPDINFNCYFFAAGHLIARGAVADFSFPRDTFVYGYRLSGFDVSFFAGQVAAGRTAIEKVGRLYDEEFSALLSCLRNSKAVKRKFKRIL